MKKKGIKRILAFFLAIVFVVTTCFTASPYLVQATEAGQGETGEGETGNAPEQGGTEAEMLSIGVTNNSQISVGPGLINGVILTLGYNGNSKTYTITDMQGTLVSTDVPYDEIANDTGRSITVSDVNGLYDVTATPTLDADTKSLKIEITGIAVKTGENQIRSNTETIYADTTNTFSVEGPWGNYINEWEIAENTSEAVFESATDQSSCEVKTGKGESTFTLVAKAGGAEIARQVVNVTKKGTSLGVTSSDGNSWMFRKNVTFTFSLKSSGNNVAGRDIVCTYEDNGQQTVTIRTNEQGEATLTIKLSRWQKEFMVNGHFAGDDIYEPANVEGKYALNKATGTVLVEDETKPQKYTANKPLEVTYGTEEKEITFALNDGGNGALTEGISTCDVTNESTDLVEVSVNKDTKTVTIVPKKASSNPVKVTIKGDTSNYKFEREIWVKVNPYPLTIAEDSVHIYAPGKTELEGQKIYDGTTNIDVQAKLEPVETDEIKPTDAARSEAAAYADVIFQNYDSRLKDVKGKEEEQKVFFKPENLNNVKFTGATATEVNLFKNNYKIQEKQQSIEATLTILKRPLKLTIGNASRGFRDLMYRTADGKELDDLKKLVSVNATEQEAGFVGGDDTTLKGFAFPEVIDTTATNLTVDNVKTDDQARYGLNQGTLQFKADDTGNATNNYKFNLSEYTSGALNITEETEAAGYVNVNNTSSEFTYEAEQNDNLVRYYGDNATAEFSLGGGYETIYVCDEDGENPDKLTGNRLSLAGENKDITKWFYLTKELNGIELSKTKPFAITFLYDNTAPDCTEIKLDQAGEVVKNLAQSITFGIYRNHMIDAKVTLADTQSGVKGMSYYIARIEQDQDYDAVSDALTDAQFTDAGNPDENNTWTIKNIGKLKDGETLESNNFVVFVKARDNVGNVMIYGSNGVVLENFHDISVTYTETAGENVKSSEWNGVNYYSGNARLNLKAEENASENKYYSGLEKMGYTVSYEEGNGSKKTDDRVEVKNEYPKDVTLGDLKGYCTITTDLDFSNDPNNSKVIKVTADANDNAGNTMDQAVARTIVLDSVAPQVTSSWKQVNNNGQFRNSKYANSNVTYTVIVQERFLKTLTVSINGTSYTLDELEAQKDALGIKSITKDPVADITKTTDQTQYHFTLVFDKDGDYTVQTTAKDAATNVTSDHAFKFVIDTVAPELEVTYTAFYKNQTTSLLDPSAGRAYANEDVEYVTATAIITEKNFPEGDNTDASVAVKAVNSKNADVAVADYNKAIQGKWNDLGEVSTTDLRHKYSMTLPVINVDANYDFAYDYTDLAGNPLKATVKHAVTLDRVRPEGTVTVEDLVNGSATQVWNKLLNTITFGYFGKSGVWASMTSADETAGVAATQYLVSANALSRGELEKRTDWIGYSSKLSLAANQHLVVYEKVTDKAGNIEFFSTDGIIVDNTNPVPTVKITPTTPAWGKGVYSAGDNPGFDVRVEDPVVNDAYAGLKTITYQIVNGTTGYIESGTLANLAKETHQQIWTGHVNINPNQFYSNDVQIHVYAEDWSTNGATSQTASLKVDNKAPIVSFSFDKNDVHNGKYYKNDKTLTITVDERNFDESYMPRVTSTAGGGYSISRWSHNGEIHTATITFSGDSDYTVSYDCYDLAGNKSNTENLEEFTVDKTIPVIKVAYNNNSALNGNYYKAARTATITVVEHNFDPSKITVSTTASAGGAPGIGGWSNNGDTHTANVVFNHDADYTFTVSGFDLAENKAADYAQDKFTVDLTDPDVKITGVKDKSANNGTVAPQIHISDTNFIASGVKVTLKGVNRGEVKVDSLANIVNTGNGMNVIFRDFPTGMDDIYTLTAKVTDKAGNETVSAITFSVNRDGSTYELSNSTKALIEKKYTNQPQDLEITEINVDDLTTIEITYSLDGKVVTLKEGTDYTIEKSGEEGQWKKYVYKIKASCFEQEGNYVINIYSEDAAENSTTNKTKAKTIEFTVDKTAPTMVVSNLADKGRYKENTHEFTLNVKDNIFLAYVEVYLDGELFKRFEEDEIAQLNGELPIDIASSNQYQTVELVSCDKAGNISKEVYDPETNEQVPASYKVLVTQNSFVQFINNTPLLISVIVILVVIVGLIIVLVKRKKDNK